MSDETEADWQAGLIEKGHDDAARQDQQAASLVSNERKQLSDVARALNGDRHGQYQASLVKRVQSLIAQRDSLDAERNRLRAENEQLKHQRDTLVEALGALSEREDH